MPEFHHYLGDSLGSRGTGWLVLSCRALQEMIGVVRRARKALASVSCPVQTPCLLSVVHHLSEDILRLTSDPSLPLLDVCAPFDESSMYVRRLSYSTGQIQVLSDHIEKLMMFLKHEATQKTKAHEQQRRLQKELELVKASSVVPRCPSTHHQPSLVCEKKVHARFILGYSFHSSD